MDKVRELIDFYKNIALSDADLQLLMEGKANVVRYSQLKNYKSINDLLIDGVCFILYEWQPKYGHWTCIIRNPETLEFFDPYGGFPDSQLKHVPEEFKVELGEDRPLLTHLLLEYDGELSYNEYQFQKLDQNVKDCGRWCVLRALLKEMSLKDFKDIFMSVYSDDIATILTS